MPKVGCLRLLFLVSGYCFACQNNFARYWLSIFNISHRFLSFFTSHYHCSLFTIVFYRFLSFSFIRHCCKSFPSLLVSLWHSWSMSIPFKPLKSLKIIVRAPRFHPCSPWLSSTHLRTTSPLLMQSKFKPLFSVFISIASFFHLTFPKTNSCAYLIPLTCSNLCYINIWFYPCYFASRFATVQCYQFQYSVSH